ncbi:MAG: bifunctional nuclease family protein [Treponema sp.]|jgi:bifunctional DNase/RNase|nr:bifunctional nuclease family protein [Treponema sp.]
MSERMYETEIWTIARMDDGTALLLHPLKSNLAVPIFIGEHEAQAILLGLDGMAVSRPLTHDLFLELVLRDSLALYRAEVYDLRDNVFYARILLTGREFSEKKPLILDSLPSDALALAVRSKCPVFISSKVTDQAGLPLEFFLDTMGGPGEIAADTIPGKFAGAEPELPGFIARRESLRLELDQAVAAEEYERAAELRDVLALLDREGRNERY